MTGTAAAAEVWATLDEAWREAFCQAWDALRTGNIPVGACAATPDGRIVHPARNRVSDRAGPPGEVFGSSLAHAEINVLARLPFPHRRDLVLTTTRLRHLDLQDQGRPHAPRWRPTRRSRTCGPGFTSCVNSSEPF